MLTEELTIIIPFLNEKFFVEHTLISIRENEGRDIPIILINDCSDDGLNYDFLAKKYNCKYVKNTERIGVAASRDKGVSMVETPYVLIIDAHMRFYKNNWKNIIIGNLKNNDRAIYCAVSKGINEDWETNSMVGYCAYFSNDKKTYGSTLEPKWIKNNKISLDSNQQVPCVLGATYAFSKKYWQLLNGLDGLEEYACDELFMSLKTFLEGGKCILMNNVEIGHLYRQKHPYSVLGLNYSYNKTFIIKTVIPIGLQKEYLSFLNGSSYKRDIMDKLKINKKKIQQDRNYYKSIFTVPFEEFIEFNKKFEN